MDVEALHASLQHHGILRPFTEKTTGILGWTGRNIEHEAFLCFDPTGRGFYWLERVTENWPDTSETRKRARNSELAKGAGWNVMLAKSGRSMVRPPCPGVWTEQAKIPNADPLMGDIFKKFVFPEEESDFGFAESEVVNA